MDSARTQDIVLNDALLNAVIVLAKEAGDAILQIYRTEFNVTQKSDHSPLTMADLQANDVITRGLKVLTPDIPILSEETSLADYETRQEWTYYWLIDPLDGTREFVKRNGEFTVNIALIQQHTPILGVVYAPVSEALFYAMQSHGAFKEAYFQDGHYQKNTGATVVDDSVCEKPLSLLPDKIKTKLLNLDNVVVAGSRSHTDENMLHFMQRLTQQLPAPPELMRMGSSLKICMVAEGIADVYPRLGLTSEWDTAAAHCILKEAGGEIVDTAGKIVRYNTKESILNPSFFAVGQNNASTWHQWWRYLH